MLSKPLVWFPRRLELQPPPDSDCRFRNPQSLPLSHKASEDQRIIVDKHNVNNILFANHIIKRHEKYERGFYFFVDYLLISLLKKKYLF